MCCCDQVQIELQLGSILMPPVLQQQHPKVATTAPLVNAATLLVDPLLVALATDATTLTRQQTRNSLRQEDPGWVQKDHSPKETFSGGLVCFA